MTQWFQHQTHVENKTPSLFYAGSIAEYHDSALCVVLAKYVNHLCPRHDDLLDKTAEKRITKEAPKILWDNKAFLCYICRPKSRLSPTTLPQKYISEL